MQKTQTTCLIILAAVATGFSLFYLKSVLLPFVIALFIVIGCRPVLELMETRLKLNRYVGFFVAFSIGSILLALFSLMTWLSINDLRQHSGVYESRLNAIAQWISGRLDSSLEQLDSTQVKSQVTADAEVVEKSATDDAKRAISEFITSTNEYMQRQLPQIAGTLSNLLSYGILILIFVFFMLIGQDGRQEHEPEIVREIESQVRRYLIMKTAISAVTGFVFGLVLWMFGVPLAILFGFLAFLLNFIPNIGPLISTLIPIPFLLLNSEMNPVAAIVCFVLVASIQFISGNVVETRIMGKTFDVSPVFLLLALMFFGLVWGIIGMFMATPIASVFKIVLQQHNTTRPLSELMAGRWANQNGST